MKRDRQTVYALYKKLLRLYPPGFRERLGESMEQSFRDLYNDRKHQSRLKRISFLPWMFTETAMGITREHLLLIIEGDVMKKMFLTYRSPAIISLVIVIPFMIMEFVNRRNFNEGFPIPLFVIIWLLPAILILTIMPIIRNLQAGNNITAQPINLLIRVVILVLVTLLWAGILIDQMPCFLGVPNCD